MQTLTLDYSEPIVRDPAAYAEALARLDGLGAGREAEAAGLRAQLGALISYAPAWAVAELPRAPALAAIQKGAACPSGPAPCPFCGELCACDALSEAA